MSDDQKKSDKFFDEETRAIASAAKPKELMPLPVSEDSKLLIISEIVPPPPSEAQTVTGIKVPDVPAVKDSENLEIAAPSEDFVLEALAQLPETTAPIAEAEPQPKPQWEAISEEFKLREFFLGNKKSVMLASAIGAAIVIIGIGSLLQMRASQRRQQASLAQLAQPHPESDLSWKMNLDRPIFGPEAKSWPAFQNSMEQVLQQLDTN